MNRLREKTIRLFPGLPLLSAVFMALILAAGCHYAPVSLNSGYASRDFSAYAPASENRMVVYTSHLEDLYAPIIKEFEERTGIWVEIVTGGTLELLERIADEADHPQCDVIFGGGIDSLESYRRRFLPYKSSLSPQLTQGFYQEDGYWTPFSILPVVLIYNTKLVRTNPPDSWSSLLDPAWKGKIAFANPEVSGSAYTALATMMQVLNEDSMESFYRNLDGQILEQSGMVVGEVGNGSCYIGVTLEKNALQGMESGYDIAMVYPREGTSAIPDGVAIISGCPHEENARRFLEFVVEKNVQTYLSESCNLRPVQKDAPLPEGITWDFPLYPYDSSLSASRQEDYLARWHSLMASQERQVVP